MRKTKILCLDHYTKIGGGQRSLLTLLENIDRNRFHPIAAIPGKGELYECLKKLDVDTRFVKLDGGSIKMHYTNRYSGVGNPAVLFLNFLLTFRCMVSLLRIIKDEGIDLIYANTFRSALIGGIAGKLFRVSVVYHMRIFPNHGWLDGLAVSLSSKVVANSCAVAKKFDKSGKSEKKISVIYNIVDLLRFHPDINGDGIKKEFKMDKNERLVGMIGRITPEKDHGTFIEAAIKVLSALPNTRFFVVGDTIFEEDKQYKMWIMQLLESQKLKNNFIFTGFRRDIPEIMASLDLLVVPSIKEPWGRVAAEAMAVGKPVVGTNVGGLPEIINHGHTGILVPPEDPDLLAEAIITLLKDEELRKRMGKAGRKKIEENFSIPIVTRQTEEFYLKVLGEAKATK